MSHPVPTMDYEGKSMNVYQRINEVRKAVDYAKKDKAVEGYKAVTHDQITALTREHLVAHGIVIVPVLISQKVELTGTQTSRGTPFIRMEASYRFDVVNVDDPTDKFSAEIAAHAIDHGDKAPGKVLSYAKKALMLKLLEIESGDEDEERQEQHKPKVAKSVAKDTWDNLPEAARQRLADIGTALIDLFNEGEDQRAFEYYTEQKEKLDVDEQVALWSRLDSEQRSTIKKLGEAHKKAEAARKQLRTA